MLIRNAPRPKAAEASTMPVDSQAPSCRAAARRHPLRLRRRTGPPSPRPGGGRDRDGHVPEPRRRRVGIRRVGAGNCWLDPGSSVRRSRSRVVSMLSGWWISVERLDGVVVALDEHGERRHLRRVVRVEHHLPDPAVRGLEVRRVQALVDASGPCPNRRCRRCSPCPGRLSYAMSSTRTNWNTLLMSLQYSRTHCGPSMPTGVAERRSVCQLPCRSAAAGSPCRPPSAPSRPGCGRWRCPSAP